MSERLRPPPDSYGDWPPEFLELVALASENALPDGRVPELERHLVASAAARDFYLNYFRLDAELSAFCHDQRAQEVLTKVERQQRDVERRVRLPLRRVSPTSLLFAASLVAIACVIAAIVFRPFAREDRKIVENPPASPAFVARVTDIDDAVWSPGQAALANRAALTAGQWLELESGTLQVTFQGGAAVALQGPARLQVQSGMAGRLNTGRVLANVPRRAIGFRVDTPFGSVVDLGTEFGLIVDDTHMATHVFQGRVETTYLAAADAEEEHQKPQRVELRAGEAATFSPTTRALEKIAADNRPFGRDVPAKAGLLDGAYRDYRHSKVGSTTADHGDGRGLPGTSVGHWNYYASATQNSSDPKANLTLLQFGPGGDAGNEFYVGNQGSSGMPAVSDVQIFRSGIDQPPEAGELAVHPSDFGKEFVVVRWTPPAKFDERVRMNVKARILGTAERFDGVTLAVFIGGAKLSEKQIRPADNVGLSFTVVGKLLPGQAIDFVVGRNGNYSNDQTGLTIDIFADESPPDPPKIPADDQPPDKAR